MSGAPHYLEGKKLSVARLTGEAQAVQNEIEAWGLDSNIVAVVFDNTASNTGRHRGATARLQRFLKKPIFIC